MNTRIMRLRRYEERFLVWLDSEVEICVPHSRIVTRFDARLATNQPPMTRGDLLFNAAGLPLLTVNSLALRNQVSVRFDAPREPASGMHVPKSERLFVIFTTRQPDHNDSKIAVRVTIWTKKAPRT